MNHPTQFTVVASSPSLPQDIRIYDVNSPEYHHLLVWWGRQAESIINSRNVIPSVGNYCPDIVNVYKCPRKGVFSELNIYFQEGLLTMFPGISLITDEDWDRFENSPTFFQARSAPPDLEDLFGESYINRKYVYVLACPGKSDQLEFFSSEELTECFRCCRDFINPKTEKEFTQQQIDRLDVIIFKDDGALDEIMSSIKITKSTIMNKMRILSEHPCFKDCLQMLLDISMYMRGWSGDGKYPLRSTDTCGKVNEDLVIDQLDKLNRQLQGEWKPFSELQLLIYHHYHLRFDEIYPTLEMRLEVVLDNENEHACIRLTSNIFAATAWFYFHNFYHTEPFQLHDLDHIS